MYELKLVSWDCLKGSFFFNKEVDEQKLVFWDRLKIYFFNKEMCDQKLVSRDRLKSYISE